MLEVGQVEFDNQVTNLHDAVKSHTHVIQAISTVSMSRTLQTIFQFTNRSKHHSNVVEIKARRISYRRGHLLQSVCQFFPMKTFFIFCYVWTIEAINIAGTTIPSIYSTCLLNGQQQENYTMEFKTSGIGDLGRLSNANATWPTCNAPSLSLFFTIYTYTK